MESRSRILGLGVRGVAIVALSLALLRFGAALTVNTASLMLLSDVPKSTEMAALESLLSAFASSPVSAPEAAIYRKLGHLQTNMGKTTQSIHTLEQGVHLYPADAILTLQLADSLAAAGEQERALQEWRRAGVSTRYLSTQGLTYYPPGQQLTEGVKLKLAAQLWPNSSNAWLEIGQSYAEQGDRKAAAEALKRAITLDRWTPQIDRRNSEPWAYYYLGLQLFYLNDLPGSYSNFEVFMKSADSPASLANPSDTALPHKLMGIIQQIQGHPREAQSHLIRVISLGIYDSEVYYWLSLAERDLHQYEQAIAHISQAISTQKDNPRYYQVLAELYTSVNNKPAAIAAMRQALKLAPDDVTIQRELEQLELP